MVVLSWIASSDSVASWVAASYYAARGRFPSFRWVLYVTLCYYKKYQKTEGRFPRLSVAEDERCGRIPRRMPREILARGFLEIRFRPDAGVPTSSSRRFRPRRFCPRRFCPRRVRRGAPRRRDQATTRNEPSTVAILAQGTHWAVATPQVFSVWRGGERGKKCWQAGNRRRSPTLELTAPSAA